jgi:hypothetical protein
MPPIMANTLDLSTFMRRSAIQIFVAELRQPPSHNASRAPIRILQGASQAECCSWRGRIHPDVIAFLDGALNRATPSLNGNRHLVWVPAFGPDNQTISAAKPKTNSCFVSARIVVRLVIFSPTHSRHCCNPPSGKGRCNVTIRAGALPRGNIAPNCVQGCTEPPNLPELAALTSA